jgi:hypothetical protein
MQNAIPAHCFDSALADYSKFSTKELTNHTPDTYRGYPGAVNTAVTKKLVNFFNTNDFALAKGTVLGLQANWEQNQLDYKPDSGFGYSTDGTNAWKYGFAVTNATERMAFVARSRSRAVGAQPGVSGAIDSTAQIELNTGTYGFGNDRTEHSGQFNYNIHKANPFYNSLLNALFPP